MIRVKWTMVAKVLKLTAAIITGNNSLFGSNTRPDIIGRSD